MKYARVKIGEILVKEGYISQEKLDLALEKQKKSGDKIGEILVKDGFITQEDICRALEKRLGIKYIDLAKFIIDQDAVKKITETLARKHDLIPIALDENRLVVAMADPLNIYAIDDVMYHAGMEIIPAIAVENQVRKAIGTYYGEEKANEAVEEFKRQYSDTDEDDTIRSEVEDITLTSPIVKLLNTVFEQAVRSRVSDIHIEPQEDFIRVRYRRDGQLEEVFRYDVALLAAMIVRIKIISEMNIAEKRKPQDGRFSVMVDNLEYDMRVSCLPTIYGEKVVIRIIDKKGLLKRKEDLIRYDSDLDKFDSIIKNSYGMVLITGPTGSGKSTTMYSMIGELNTQSVNIVTVEDPVEASIAGINQVHVNAKAGLDFTSALRSFLRQDPDIIVVGEIRDKETVEIAVRAAITGHLVVSTLHTNDAPSSITRLLDMNIEPFLIGASLVGIIAQRLVRKICDECKDEYIPTPTELNMVKDIADIEHTHFYKGKGCHVCNYTGYRGRVGVYEIMPITPAVKDLINRSATTDEIRDAAVSEGMNTLKMYCTRLVVEGITTLEELIRIAYALE